MDGGPRGAGTFQHLLVPLDGSRLAESVFPIVRSLADRFRATVTLLHVIERRAPATVHGDRHLAAVAEAEAYLREVASGPLASAATRIHVHETDEGGIGAAIAGHGEELRAGIIVLCAHGRSGAREVLYGGVAAQVLSRGTAPVLLVRPAGSGTAESLPYNVRRLVVPLDGSPASEAALAPAAELAAAFDAEIALAMVVPTVATASAERAPAALLLPGATAASLDMDVGPAREYLSRVAEALRARGLRAEVVVERGDPAAEVLALAERRAADLLVLATHGKAGMSAVWAGSVASRIAGRSTRPMLLIRAVAGEAGSAGGRPAT